MREVEELDADMMLDEALWVECGVTEEHLHDTRRVGYIGLGASTTYTSKRKQSSRTISLRLSSHADHLPSISNGFSSAKR